MKSPSKHRVVVFTKHNARIINNPPPYVLKYPNAVIDPDLSNVRKVPPHLWKLEDGRILPMADWEQKKRLAQIKDILKFEGPKGLDNEIRPLLPHKLKPRTLTKYKVNALLMFILAAYGAMFLVLHHERVWRTLNEIGVVAYLGKVFP